MDPATIEAFLRLGLGIVAVIGFLLEIVVTGRAYRRALAERDSANARLDRFIDVVEAATGVKAPK